jgi:hypothetical protein
VDKIAECVVGTGLMSYDCPAVWTVLVPVSIRATADPTGQTRIAVRVAARQCKRFVEGLETDLAVY